MLNKLPPKESWIRRSKLLSPPNKPIKWFGLLCLLFAMAALAPAQAAQVTFDFNTDPEGSFAVFGTDSTGWRSTGGVNNSGYFSITDALNGQSGTIVFPDFDSGLIVKAFSFTVDIRTGGGTARPADGFSINYARAGDPVITTGTGFAASPGNEANLPEEGTTTGLGIGFDTWDSGSGDVVGISVRVDNQLLAQYAYPTLNGALTDLTSLQTGPLVTGEPEERLAALGWAPFEVDLKEDGSLTIKYKNAIVVENLATDFFPSAGRLVLAGRTGGANAYHHVDNVRITTVPANTALVSGLTSSPLGFVITIDDQGDSVVDPATIQLKFSGSLVTPKAVTKAGAVTSISYDFPNRLVSGSVHEIELTFKDNKNNTISAVRNFTTPIYSVVPAHIRVAESTVNKNQRGFNILLHQIEVGRPNLWGTGDGNNLPAPLYQLHDMYLDPATGSPRENLIDSFFFGEFEKWTGPIFAEDGVINYNQDSRDNTEAGTGVFTPDKPIPGIPGFTLSTDNIAMRAATVLELKRGIYRMAVNSDDGFVVAAGANSRDILNVYEGRLGIFNGGRGAATTAFNCVIEEDGFYPFALYWWEGGGGANVEWWTEDVATGERFLVNDNNAKAVKAYRTANEPPYIKWITPLSQLGGRVTNPNADIEVIIVDGGAVLNAGSIAVEVDGETVTASTSKSGNTSTVKFKPKNGYVAGKSHAVKLTYADNASPARTQTAEFTVNAGNELILSSPGILFIETEDFNYGKGNWVKNQPIGMTGTYPGGAYQGLGGMDDAGVDWFEPNTSNDQPVYRPDTAVEAGKRGDTANPGPWGLARGAFNVQVNHLVGWNDAGDWANYTRDFPTTGNTRYQIYGRLASGGAPINAELARVTSNPAQPNQTKEVIGVFNPGRATGGWDSYEIFPLTDVSGKPVVVDLQGNLTLRLTTLGGNKDSDYLAFVPTTQVVGPSISELNPGPGGDAARNHTITATFRNGDSKVAANTVKLFINGAAVSAGATATADGATLSYTPPNPFPVLSTVNAKLEWSDDSTPAVADSVEWSYKIGPFGPDALFIEAEDFDFGGGKYVTDLPIGLTGAYPGGAYQGLGTADDQGIDFNSNSAEGQSYRPDTLIAAGKLNSGLIGRFRGEFEVEVNHVVGWNDTGEWMNYTRVFPEPAKDYNLVARASSGGSAINFQLDEVTAGVGTANQTLQKIGVVAPGRATGGWDSFEMFPVTGDDGNLARVTLGGKRTLRLTFGSGNHDVDWVALVPAGEATQPGPGVTVGIARSGANVIISWTGAGTLESADVVTGPWSSVGGANSPHTVTPNTGIKFYRIRQ
jgi:hypothetical protein